MLHYSCIYVFTGAYETLKSCSEHKEDLTKTIEHTNDLIKGKRKHLEELRDEMKLLGKKSFVVSWIRDTKFLTWRLIPGFFKKAKSIPSNLDAYVHVHVYAGEKIGEKIGHCRS